MKHLFKQKKAWSAWAVILIFLFSFNSTAQTKYEAENASLTGVTVGTSRAGYSGSGYIDGFDNTGDKVTFTVNVASAGAYPLVIRYSSPMGEKMQDLIVNGTTLKSCNLTFSSNTDWVNLNYGNINLNAGNNTISIVKCYGWFYLDYITVGTGGTSSPTIVNDNVTGTGDLQFNYSANWGYVTGSGAFNGDEHYTLTAGSTYSFKFTGTQIKVFGTKDAHHGIGGFSIDGGAEVNVDFFASTRAQQVLLWTSPVLTAGPHTLTVRATGNKNVSSTGIVIVADKMEVNATTVSSYSLNVSATNGSVSKSPNQSSYAPGATVTLTATPNSGYTFSGWSGDATGTSNPLTVTMNSSKNITANFTAVSSTTLVDPNATAETRKLWTYLNAIYGQKVLTGIWEKSGLDNVQANSGKVAAILGQDMWGWHPRQSSIWYTVMGEQSGHLVNHYNNGGIVQVNWHWGNPFDHSKDAWSDITAAQWNNLVTPGTAEYNTIIGDIDLHVNNFLKKLVDKNGRPIPVLFRPLHEIDGGWFWWTNESDPSKTVALYKIIFDRIKNHHGMHNLIWVWNNSEVAKTATASGRYYPGNSYADIVAIDLYHTDYQNTGRRTEWDGSYMTYKQYYDMLGQIAPGKPRALGEGDALPNAEKTQNNDPNFPKWLYALAWWSPSDGNGTGMCQTSPCNPASWVNTTFNHNVYITLDELQTNGTTGSSMREAFPEPSPNSSQLAVFPNPNSDGKFNIGYKGFLPNETLKIDVLKADGKAIFSVYHKANEHGEGEYTPGGGQNLNSGLYIIKAEGMRKTLTEKMLVR